MKATGSRFDLGLGPILFRVGFFAIALECLGANFLLFLLGQMSANFLGLFGLVSLGVGRCRILVRWWVVAFYPMLSFCCWFYWVLAFWVFLAELDWVWELAQFGSLLGCCLLPIAFGVRAVSFTFALCSDFHCFGVAQLLCCSLV